MIQRLAGFVLIFYCLVAAQPVMAEETRAAVERWEPTTLSEATIQKVQGAKHHYLQCIAKAVKEERYQKLDTRVATDAILKSCETSLSAIREAFLSEKVPASVADRYLKRTRTQTARSVLENMMYAAASRSGTR